MPDTRTPIPAAGSAPGSAAGSAPALAPAFFPGAPPIHVALLAVPETTPGTLYGLMEVFAAVGTVWTELTGQPAAGRRMVPSVVAEGGRPFDAAGAPIAPQAGLDDGRVWDVVIATDLALPAGADPRGRWPAASAWLAAQAAAGAMVCSVCTGSLLLAEAGLLDGRDATTHWSAAGLFRTAYPAVRLRAERILCPADPAARVITAGGSAAWTDLALHLIARLSSPEEAVRAAKIFLIGDRSAGQRPFARLAAPPAVDDPAIAACQSWIAEHYAAPNPVARMIARSGLTERTFKRRFRAATGYSAVEWVQHLRIEEAKQLLERTGDPTDTVAAAVGYEDPAFFRKLFKRLTGETPAAYRRRWRA